MCIRDRGKPSFQHFRLGMVAMLGADNRVYLGREERCHYQNMQPSYYDNQDGSLLSLIHIWDLTE